jgi:hypothetical protein
MFLLAIVVASESRQEFHEFRQCRWLDWGRCFVGHVPNGLPFIRCKDLVAGDVWIGTAEECDVHDPPGNDLVERQCVLHASHCFQLQGLHATPGFQRLEVLLDSPSASIVVEHQQDLFHRVDRE